MGKTSVKNQQGKFPHNNSTLDPIFKAFQRVMGIFDQTKRGTFSVSNDLKIAHPIMKI